MESAANLAREAGVREALGRLAEDLEASRRRTRGAVFAAQIVALGGMVASFGFLVGNFLDAAFIGREAAPSHVLGLTVWALVTSALCTGVIVERLMEARTARRLAVIVQALTALGAEDQRA
jgi:hypothetical protein